VVIGLSVVVTDMVGFGRLTGAPSQKDENIRMMLKIEVWQLVGQGGLETLSVPDHGWAAVIIYVPCNPRAGPSLV
jgi:hypothetical protein